MGEKDVKKNVAIVFGITNDFVFALANVLIGMKRHCKPFWDDIIVYHDGINEKEIAAVNSIISCKFIYFDENLFNDKAIHSEALKDYSLLTLARFECFALLKEYHKVIWHDVDILVQKDFSYLMEYGDQSGYAATQSTEFRMEQNFFGIMPGYDMLSYLYNAGILVLSDKLPNPDELHIYCYNTFNRYAEKLRFNDQAVLNMLIQDYGIDVELIDLDKYCCHPNTKSYKDAAIIHAYGKNKFWNSLRLERQFPEWLHNNTEWENIKWSFEPKELSDYPKVSVIMSIYDRTEYMDEAVQSILQQSFSDFEFIIVVEKSPVQKWVCDKLEAYGDKRIVVIPNKEKVGFPASLNYGLEIAKGMYIARMDDDDISLPDRFEKEVRYLDTHKDISIVGCWIQMFGHERKIEQRPETHEKLKVWAIKENPMFHPTVMIRKKDIDLHGFRYDPKCLTEDYDLWLRMMGKCKFANIPEVLHKFRASGKNATAYKAQKVLECHLDLMKRNLKENLKLDFSQDEMLLLRQETIVYECFNSDDMKALRNTVIKDIYTANKEIGFYDEVDLERYLGQVDLGLKTKIKEGMKPYPRIYNVLRKLYRGFFRKDSIPQTVQSHSLAWRIKTRLLPPSSRSFHNRIQVLEDIQNRNTDLINKQEVLIYGIDELIRRELWENRAGIWGLYCMESGACGPGLYEEFMRTLLYKDYVSAMHVLTPLLHSVPFNSVMDLNCREGTWLYSLKMLGIQRLGKHGCLFQKKSFIWELLDCEEQVDASEKYDLAISVLTEKSDISENEDMQIVKILCKASDIILFDVKADIHEDNMKTVEDRLDYWKQEFMLQGYYYYDLRPYFIEDWEILPEHKWSICIFITSEHYDQVVSKIEDNWEKLSIV